MRKVCMYTQKVYHMLLAIIILFYSSHCLAGKRNEAWKDETLFQQSEVDLTHKIPFGKSGAYRYIVEKVTEHPVVKSLNLSENHLQQEDIEILIPIFKGAHLETLILRQCDIGSDGAIVLLRVLKENPAIKNLDISANGIEGYGIAKIDENLKGAKNLKALNLSHNPIGSRVAPQLLNLLASGLPAEELDLTAINLNDRGLHTIAQGIAYHPSLKVLSLNENPFGDLGATSIDYLLSCNSSLKKLYLNHCDITDEGLVKIASGLKMNKALECLEIAQEQPFSIGVLEGAAKEAGFTIDKDKTIFRRSVN